MTTTRRSVIIFAVLFASATVHAQWLTKADESSSYKSENHSDPQLAPGDRDAGVGDAFKWYWHQRTFGLGYIPQGALQKAEQQRDAMREGMTIQSTQPQWTLIGPNNIGGRVNTIAINPYNPNSVYVGAANGGVWKTTNGGAHWTPLTDQLQSLSMGALGIDPNDTNIVFAGTGELSPAVDAYGGYGLLRSTNGGATWSDVGPSSVGAYTRVIVNPNHSNIVYAAAGRSGGGVLRSSDGGNSWTWLAGGLPQNQSVSDLALSMNGDTAVLYAGVAGNGVYLSTDGGDTWALTPTLPFPEGTSMVRIALDVDPANWQNVVVLDVNSGTSDDLGGIESSTDGGNTWTEIDQEWQGNPLFSVGTPPQGWYDVYIKVDPTNFNHMLVGGLSVWQTLDGGQTWTDVAQSYKGGIHPDQHAAAFAPSDPNFVFLGNDGGVFSSKDGGSTITQQTFLLPITQFYGIGIDQTQGNVTYGGTQDNGTLSGSSANTDWGNILGGDGTMTQVDPKTTSIVYCETPQSFPTVYPNGSNNTGLNANIDSTVWIDPFAADATNDIIYWGCQRLAYSKNQGQSWTNCTKVFGSASAGTTISAIDAFGDGKTVLVGTGGGNVYITANNGVTFTDVSAGLPARAVTWVKFSPSSKTTFYVTLSGFGAGHIFKTTNNGSNWTDISSRLPDISVNTIVMDPQNTSVLYVGTDVGVFFSPNDGAEWMPYGTGLPNTGIDFMEVHVNNRVIRAGTHGRSIWQVPLQDDATGIVLPAQRSVWTLGDTASIQWHGFAPTVSLDLSLDGGTSWQNIATGVSDTIYPISDVNYPASENSLVRVNDGADTVISPLFSIAQQKAGNQIGTVADLRFYAYDIAYDKDDNVLWATDFDPSEDYIFKLDPDAGTILDSVKIPVSNPSNRQGFTGIKYDPVSQHLFLQEVYVAGQSWTSNLYEVDTTGQIVRSAPSPATYGTGIFLQGDTLLVVDRQQEVISRALNETWDFTVLNPLSDLQLTRNATYGPRGLTYDPKLGEYLLAYTDFQGTSLNGSYLLFLDPESGAELNSFTIAVGGELTNVRGMEYDPRGAGNTAWMTVLNTGGSAQIIKIALTDGPAAAPSATMTLQPSVIAFGNVDTGKTKTIQVEIHNTGAAPASITAINIIPAGTAFTLGNISLPVTLKPGDSLPVTVTFAPHSMDAQDASLSVTYGSDNQQAEFPISGFATVNGAGVSTSLTTNTWGIELSPNPARDFVDVTLDAASADVAEIHIFDVTGREVRNVPLGMISNGEHETQLTTTGLPNGVYFLRVMSSAGAVAAARLAIER